MKIRSARPADWPAIKALTQRARRTFPRLWWWEEHLTEPGFLVAEQEELVVGALFACADESPVAWVRLAALDDDLDADAWLNLALPPVLNELRRHGLHALAWMDYQGWAGPYLKRHGFEPFVEVMTLIKRDRKMPDVKAVGVRLRPASDVDIPAVVAVDRAAFTPYWWHSEATMRRKMGTLSYFTVAESAGDVVGYAEGELGLPSAHLNRIAVHPDHQDRGIGALLLCDAMHAFWRREAEQITLNTQRSNRRSLRLYRRFSFEPTGDVVTVWTLQL